MNSMFKIFIALFLLCNFNSCERNESVLSDYNYVSDLLSNYAWSAKSKFPNDDPKGKIEFCADINKTSYEFYNDFGNFRYKNSKTGSYEVLNITKDRIDLKMTSGRDDNLDLWSIVFVNDKVWYWQVGHGNFEKWFRYRCEETPNNEN
ncbi:MAG: hypothetical protein HRU38_02760 [Saccharospirillaceae bacterium]|nr:hypothetical protein [Pseudomonadales bacterium]NRB77583.1 hypothetical protein [Saccharospirillaceae bacterium]